MRFTNKGIQALSPHASRYEVAETNGRGFRLRVHPTGRRTFVYRYKYQSRPRVMILGPYPDVSLAEAHRRHAEARVLLKAGTDPGAEAVAKRRGDRGTPNVADLAAEYLERWAKPNKKSWREDQRILTRNVLPAWKSRKVKDLTRRDVVRLLDKIVDRGAPIMANRTLALVRRMLNFAVERGILPASPCVRVKAPGRETRRDRVLSRDEIATLWRKLAEAHMSKATRLALQLLLVTAQRKGEVIGARWEEIDMTRGWWIIPAERSKNGMPHRVPLSSLASDILVQAKALSNESPWVFPSPTLRGPIGDTGIDQAVRRSEAALGIAPFVPHDLRRTAASHMAAAGIPRLVISKILNHADRSVTAVYERHGYDDEKRTALERWARTLWAVVTSEAIDTKVIGIRSCR